MTLSDDLLAIAEGRPARDRAAITAFAGQVRRAESARDRIDTDGVVVEKANGDLVAHPAVEIERSASREIRGWVERRPDLFGSVLIHRDDLMPLGSPADQSDDDDAADDAPPSLEDELARARAARSSPA
ncbi:hypothetical protein GS4_47_00080 [Gordonia soli NBRC 108243]|uniref:Uncharacterized protein n=1 Tax=Gordonia soli NBRC 108243 TaxID=1223545 RepID=M0QR04_9ACTN|nr:hypothetical protein GS4_47_00080 [Gordonia soli NBRC 108243]